MSRPVVCIALVVATLTACVQTQDEHSPAAQALAALRASAEACRRMPPGPSRGTAAPLNRATPARSTTSGGCTTRAEAYRRMPPRPTCG